ncbi:hypothetical protein DBR06_SOUSAS13410004, partial [Sousa chinensis]
MTGCLLNTCRRRDHVEGNPHIGTLCISINMLADKLIVTPEEAERWIVNLIRNARLDAEIDSKLGHVVMGDSVVSSYQQVIEKAKSLSFRSQILVMNIEKKHNQNGYAGWEQNNLKGQGINGYHSCLMNSVPDANFRQRKELIIAPQSRQHIRL